MLMLTVCFDVAGKDDNPAHNVIVVAGFAGFAKTWDDFQNDWNARLQQDDIKAFHAGDFSHFEREFKSGWRDDEKRRRRLCSDLMEIIRSNGLRRFGCVVPIAIQKRMNQDLMKQMRIGEFVHGASVAVSDFHAHAFNIGHAKNLRYIFEKGDPEDALRQRFKEDGYQTPDFMHKAKHVSRKGIIDDGFVGLQAAGWIAYEYYLGATHYRSGQKVRWPLTQFEGLPGEIKAQTASTAANNEGAFRIRQATQYLERIKREGERERWQNGKRACNDGKDERKQP